MIIDPPLVFFLNDPTIFDFGFPVPFPSLPENQSPLQVSSATEFIPIPSNSFHPSVSYLLIHVYYPFPQFSPRFSPLSYIFPYSNSLFSILFAKLPPLPNKASSLPIVLKLSLVFLFPTHISRFCCIIHTQYRSRLFLLLQRSVFSTDPSLEQRDANTNTLVHEV